MTIPTFSSAQCVPPSCVNNIRGKVVSLPMSVAVLSLGGQTASEPIDINKAYLVWSLDTTNTADDLTLPCCTPVLVNPDLISAASSTYRISTMDSITVISPTVIMINNVSCSFSPLPNTIDCKSAPLAQILPNLGIGGTFTLRISLERLPKIHESIYSDPVTFTVGQIITPPPVQCIASEWEEWSPYFPVPPIPPATKSTLETRHRNRIITNMPCINPPFLVETETRNIPIAPPIKQCPYIATGGTVNVPKNVGTVIETFRQPVLQRARVGTFLYWFWKVEINPIDAQFDHIKVTCQGPP